MEEKQVIIDEKIVDMFKALSNATRLKIIQMLKEPENNFPPQVHIHKGDDFQGGVCVGDIRDKIGLVQSTTSQYLSLLQQSGLLEMKRIGQWTYYRRNEKVITQLEGFIGKQL
ncbi:MULTISPECIES: ArsR/SmtB family transcription factor [Bacillaceae]|uniref:ArsR family transcriptional regulator n=1 Tax=Peribacillus huizhouensis TaxID=1501239 RepID=A0ABR6CUB5_9BACI|nr:MULTISPECIES: helix-turn-helix domain-containing protein [Bacillaceae]MBA9028511.1 ArsR family transcriptional regulator [Peribacillus huizhouensis]